MGFSSICHLAIWDMQQEINEYQHNFNMDRKEQLITFLQSLDENHQFFYINMNIAFHEHNFFWIHLYVKTKTSSSAIY